MRAGRQSRYLFCQDGRWFLNATGGVLQPQPHPLAMEILPIEVREDVAVFLCVVPVDVEVAGCWVSLRSLLNQVEGDLFPLLSRAAQLLSWHQSHRFCSRCGQATEQHASDMATLCPQCGYHQYPRISPCIIVLVTRGEQMLLAHASRFGERRFSTLAGFIEAGESAENAVHREVREEVGIEIGNLRYAFSQSWPFPHSLMLGFYAQYETGELRPDGVEIIEAGWFSADALPQLPPRFTIARRLIDGFLAELAKPI